MQILSYLANRELGVQRRNGLRCADYKLDLDALLTRFVCFEKDAIPIQEATIPPLSCKFRQGKQNNFLTIADENGGITLYDTDRKSRLVCTFQSHANAVFDICWVPNAFELISGSGDHSAILWDMDTCSKVSVFVGHNASVKSVDVCNNQKDIFTTGSRDGNIGIWDRRESNNKPSIFIKSAHTRKFTTLKKRRSLKGNNFASSVASVAFQDIHNLASAGAGDGFIKIWDLRKTYIVKSDCLPMPKYQMEYSDKNGTHGTTSLIFDSVYKNLYACCFDNRIYQFDCHSYSKRAITYEGFRCDTYFVKLSLSYDDQFLLSGSSDKKAYIWNTSKPGLPIVELPGHNAECTSVAWSPNCLTKLATSGDDCKVLVWRTENLEKIVEKDSTLFIAATVSQNKNNPVPIRTAVAINTTTMSPLPSSQTTSFHTPKMPAMKSITSFFHPVSSTLVSPHTCTDLSRINDFVTPSKEDCKETEIRSPCKMLAGNQVSPLSKVSTFTPVGKENETRSDQMKRKLELTESLKNCSKPKPSDCNIKKSCSSSKKRRHTGPNSNTNSCTENLSITRYFRAALPPEN